MSRRYSSKRRKSSRNKVETVSVEDAVENALEEISKEIKVEEEPIEEEFEAYELEDIEGVGRVTAEKLRNAGYYTVRDIAFASVKELAEAIGSEDRARALIIKAQKLIFKGKTFMTAKEFWESRQGIRYISTGCKALDDLLGGGIETQAVTEFVGESSRIRSLLSHWLCFAVQLTFKEEDPCAKAVYIDTEGAFRPERIVQLAKDKGIDVKNVLKNIIYARAHSLSSLILLIEDLFNKDFKILLISSLDNVISYELSLGKSSLNILSNIAKLYLKSVHIAFEKNAAVVFFFIREPRLGNIFFKRFSKIVFFREEENKVVFSDSERRSVICQIDGFQ